MSDFGLSKLVDEGTLLKTYCGTPYYVGKWQKCEFQSKRNGINALSILNIVAPEVVRARTEDTVYTKGCDVWSMGIILFVLLSGVLPFNTSVSSLQLEKQILKGGSTLDFLL